jgi:hypothetical protein
MEENLVVDVDAINLNMKIQTFILFFFTISIGFAQQDSTKIYKKRVLETTEVDFLSSYYTQDGQNASVTGGIGDEHLTDFTPTIVVSMPLNADDVLTIDAGISTYTSASSSNLNPFDRTGASGTNGEEDDDRRAPGDVIGSPWVTSSGASRQDTWASVSGIYSHSSDDRNTLWNADVSLATEYDYFSLGFGGGITKLFNEKNTTLGVSAKIYLDTWNPQYPTELKSYDEVNGDLNAGFFNGVTILDQNGNASTNWQPIDGFELIQDKARNSYALSFSFSQILSKNAQFSLFFDLVRQDGWLANPMQRVYFADVSNYFIGNAASIPNYTSPTNKDVFQLADDIERLPNSRFKIPIGMRFHYYINEVFTIRTYYRYYFDDWGVNSHTAGIEVPIKISPKFTLYPSYRYYTQTQADYFAPFDTHLSTSEYYTSDFDLSEFNANQYGIGIGYTDVFSKFHLWQFGLKSIDLNYNNYQRNTGLNAYIVSLGFKFVMD